MKKFMFLALLLIPFTAAAQFTPPPSGAYSFDTGAWAPITGTGSVGALDSPPPPIGLYCKNGSGQWIPWTTAGCGGGGGGGTGTVTSVSVVTANGISGSVANPTTTPAMTLTLGAITPTSTNGVSAATMAFVDPSSSIQTQLNSKASSTATLTLGSTTLTLGGTTTSVSGLSLVAPALGTPASGVLTNATGLPAASVVAGALANSMTATTQSANDNSTKLATTAYVDGKAGGNWINITNLVGTPTGCTVSGSAPFICTINASTSVVTFPTIPGTYLNLKFYFSGFSSTGSVGAFNTTFNGDTGAHYDEYSPQVNGSATLAVASAFAGTSFESLLMSGTSGHAGGGYIEVPGYTQAFNKFASGVTGALGANNAGSFSFTTNAGWNSTAAITSATFTTISGNASGYFIVYASN